MRYKKRNGTLGNIIWKFGERIIAQVVSTIVAIILARILSPEDYGVIAVVSIYITFCNAFVVGGLGNALIQKQDADELDFSSIFYTSVGLSFVIYIIMFFVARPISLIYNNEALIMIIRVMSLRLPVAAINSIQQAYIARKMEFRKFFIATLFGTIVSAAVGIIMALSGFGVWALVAQYLTNVTIDTVVLFVVGGWVPKIVFSISRVKNMLPFGLKLMGATLIDTAFQEVRSILISTKYTSIDLAMYENGRKYPNLLVTNINTSISSVMFPVMSKEQNNIDNIKGTMKKSITVSTYLLAPLLLGLFACGHQFVNVILTSKWEPCVPYLRITCIMCLFYPIHTINLQALNAIGESGKNLKLEIIKKVINITILIPTVFMGVIWIAIGAMCVSLLSTYINAYYSKRLFNYSFSEQIKDIFPTLGLSCVMVIVILIFEYCVMMNPTIKLFLTIFIGASVYIVCSAALRFTPFILLMSKIKQLLKMN